MSQKQYIQSLYDQLQRLNDKIDRKIMMGRAYKLEARQHRMIISKIRKHKNPGFFDRMFGTFNYV